MRLLNTSSLELREFFDSDVPAYAILSHTWESEEVTLQDLSDPHGRTKKGFSKIQACCLQARKDEYEWVWVDTCCIDKTSSAELSEAINSMFMWYRKAAVCYVYLSDLVADITGELDFAEFKGTRWFTRGWTLQELIAPTYIEFYDQSWNEVGTKLSLAISIAERTGIRTSVLRNKEALSDISVGERMCWAAERKTSRLEDTAYCLLGIFNIQMPLLYGEGSKAFIRLQQEILRVSEDSTIFMWTSSTYGFSPVLTTDPSDFNNISFSNVEEPESVFFVKSWESIHAADTSDPFFPLINSNSSPPVTTSRGILVNWPYVKWPHAVQTTADEPGLFVWTGYCIASPYQGQRITGYLCIMLRSTGSSSTGTGSPFLRHPYCLYYVPGDMMKFFVGGEPFYLAMGSPGLELDRFPIGQHGISWKQHPNLELKFYGPQPRRSIMSYDSGFLKDNWTIMTGARSYLHLGFVQKNRVVLRFGATKMYDAVIGISSNQLRGPFICYAIAEEALKQVVLDECSRLGTSDTLNQLVDGAQTDRHSVCLPDNKHMLIVAFRSRGNHLPILALELRDL